MSRDETTTAIGVALLAWIAWLVWRPLTATVTTSETYDTDALLSGSTSYGEPLKRFARAIAYAEGYGIPGAVPTVAKNPGDLVLPGWTPTLGAGIAVFDSVEQGWNRLYKQLGLIVSGGSSYYHLDMSIAQMGLTYAGGDANWGKNVASHLGVSPSTKLWQVLV